MFCGNRSVWPLNRGRYPGLQLKMCPDRKCEQADPDSTSQNVQVAKRVCSVLGDVNIGER